MTFVPLIQSFVSDNTDSAVGTLAMIDWPNLKIFPYQLASPCAISRFNFSSGAEETHGVVANTTNMQSPNVGSNGYFYVPYGIGSEWSGAHANLTSDFSYAGNFGIAHTFPDPDGPPDSIPFTGALTPVRTGNLSWMASVSGVPFGTGGHSISILTANGVPTFAGHIFYMTSGAGNSWQVCEGMPGTGTCFTMESLLGDAQINLFRTVIGNGAISYDPATWPVPNSGIVTVPVGSLLPAAIDPSFNQITCTGIVCDQTDGNLIVQILAGNGIANVNYIIKVRSLGCALMWAVQCTAPQCGPMMSRGIVKGSSFAILQANGFSKQLTVINTITGAATTTTSGISGIITAGPQCFNAERGCVVSYVTYAGGANPPPIGNTPDSFSGWSAIYVTQKVLPPYVPGGKQTYTKIWGAPGPGGLVEALRLAPNDLRFVTDDDGNYIYVQMD